MEVIMMSEYSDTYKSILKSVCDKLDSRDYTVFYDDLIATINTCFAFCHEYGCGPEEGFRITGPDEVWDDYVCKSEIQKDLAKGYIFAKAKITFDPPQSGPMLQSLERQITEYTWHITNFR